MFTKLLNNISKSKKIAQLEKHWINIMANLGKYNKLKQTYSLNNTQVTSYGFKADILLVDGLRYADLDQIKDIIEDNLGCMLVLNKNRRSNLATAEFIFKAPTDLKFGLLKQKLKPWEIYVGNSYSGEPIIVDLIKYPHVLITGGTRSGKSKQTDCILTTLIANCSEEELELYLCQVAKSDLILYEDAKQTRAFADNLQNTITMLNHIKDKMDNRDKLIRPYRKKALADNYFDYNKINPNQKLSTVYVVFDEMSSLFQTKGDGNDEKKLKEQIIFLVRKVAQFGAGLGVFLICSLQRPTADNLDPFIKSQSTASISFRQNNSKSSEVALDDAKIALGLEQREFIYHTTRNEFGIVPLINNKEVYNIIKPHLKPNHRNLWDDIQKQHKNKSKIKVDQDKVVNGDWKKLEQPTKEEILKKNIAKIPDYVPYDSCENLTVIDCTKLSNRSEKPNKKGRVKL